MCVEKKRERRKEKDRVRSLGVKRGAKGGKFSKNEKIGNEGERERSKVLRSNANDHDDVVS